MKMFENFTHIPSILNNATTGVNTSRNDTTESAESGFDYDLAESLPLYTLHKQVYIINDLIRI